MCTMIATQVAVAGSGKGPGGWFPVQQANVSYDHPFDVPLEYALNIDFVNEAQGPGARVAVELDAASARGGGDDPCGVGACEAGGYLDGAAVETAG